MKKQNNLAKTNILIILLFSVVLLIEMFFGNSLTKWIKPPVGLFLILIGSFNLTILIQYLFKIKFSLLEFLSVSFALLLIVFPFLLTLEFTFLGKVSDWFSTLNLFAVMATTTLLSVTTKNKRFLKFPIIKNLNTKDFIRSFHFKYLGLTLVLFLILVLSYRTLPDLDPYSWLFKYEAFFEKDSLTNLWARPLFSSLSYFFISVTGLSLFTFFKYILPFLFLLLFPSFSLIAEKLPSDKHRTILWFLILSSPSTILYLITPMPQLPLIVLMFYFSLTLFYSHLTKKSFFHYFAGFIIFSAFFYHQSAALLFIPWLIVTIISERKKLLANKTTSFLILMLIISNFSIIFKIFSFVKNWTILVYSNFKDLEINLLFPAYYKNIDSIEMGWKGIDGVIKFYSYYAGPLNIIFSISFLLFLIKNSKFKNYLFKSITKSRELIIILIILLIFLIISDFLPRIGNIALLPDRAWIYIGIFFLPFFLLLISYFKKIHSLTVSILAVLFIIGLSGSVYINYLKKYLITPDQLQSAEWIKENLPEQRLLFSSGHRKLLFFHARSNFETIPQDYFCTNNIALFDFKKPIKKSEVNAKNDFYKYKEVIEENIENTQNEIENSPDPKKIFQDFISKNSELNKKFNQAYKNIPSLDRQIKGIESENSKKIKTIYNPTPIHEKDPRKYYIYFAKEDKRNPYIQRPYSVKAWGKQVCNTEDFIFNQYPEKFKEVYNDDNEVIIWEVL